MIYFSDFSVAGGGAGPTSTQWRLYFPDGQRTHSEDIQNMTVQEVDMKATAGGADQCTGGTASASSEPFGSYAAAQAFDNGAFWWEVTADQPCWLQYTFSTAVSVEQVTMTIGDTVEKGPVFFFVQYYDGSAWQTYFDSDVNATFPLVWASTSEVKTFTRAGAWSEGAGAKRWRLLINDGAPSSLQLVNIGLYNESSVRFSYGGPVSASSNLGASWTPQQAFDTPSGGAWVPNPQPGDGAWIEYQHFKNVLCEEVRLTNTSGAGDTGPRDVSVQYYDEDTTSWVTDWGFTTGAWSSTQETRTFTKP